MKRPNVSLPEPGSRTEFLQFAMQLDDLAYIRRAKGIETSWEGLMKLMSAKRREMLNVTDTRLAVLAALIEQQWSQLEMFVEDAGDIVGLQERYAATDYVLRAPITPTRSARRIGSALKDTVRSMQRFNDHWQRFLVDFDYEPLNRERADYNKYYPIEKACAFASDAIGFEGFQELAPVNAETLVPTFPPLQVPRLRGRLRGTGGTSHGRSA